MSLLVSPLEWFIGLQNIYRILKNHRSLRRSNDFHIPVLFLLAVTLNRPSDLPEIHSILDKEKNKKIRNIKSDNHFFSNISDKSFYPILASRYCREFLYNFDLVTRFTYAGVIDIKTPNAIKTINETAE